MYARPLIGTSTQYILLRFISNQLKRVTLDKT